MRCPKGENKNNFVCFFFFLQTVIQNEIIVLLT